MKILFFVLNSISIILIAWIQFELFPYIECSLSNKTANNLNEFIYIICSGIVVSSIFYVAVAYIPKKTDEKKFQKIVQDELNVIGAKIQRTIAILCLKYDWPTNSPNLEGLEYSNHFEKILEKKIKRGDRINVSYKLEGDFFADGLHIFQLESDYFLKEQEIINNTIEFVLKYPLVINGKPELIDCLYKLRSCSFYKYIKEAQKNNFIAILPDKQFNKILYEYYEIFLRLQNFISLKSFTIKKYEKKASEVHSKS